MAISSDLPFVPPVSAKLGTNREHWPPGRAEGGKVVAAEDARFEAARGEEAEDAVEVVEECVLVAVFDGEVEYVLTACVPEGKKLLVPFYAGWIDRADVVVADAFPYSPQ